MNAGHKNLFRFFGAAALCFAAVNAWADQTQQITADEEPENITAENLPASSHDSAAADYKSPVQQDETTLTSTKKTTTHPSYSGMDQLDHFHQAASDSLDGEIDVRSLRCLSCHDGINAPETRIKTVGEWDTPFDFDKQCHPLGISYDTAGSGKTALKPLVLLPPEIILPEGKVGCESCHNLHSSNPHFLHFNRADGLCLRCHIK